MPVPTREATGMHYWKECGRFFRECRRQFRSTGAVLPSTRFLARALVSELRKPREAGRILEVGPGTRSVTKEILRTLKTQDRLDLVEINPRFITLLQERFDREWEFRFYRDQVALIHSAVEALPGEGVYDFIVSGLPLNNFPVATVRTIFRAYNRL